MVAGDEGRRHQGAARALNQPDRNRRTRNGVTEMPLRERVRHCGSEEVTLRPFLSILGRVIVFASGQTRQKIGRKM
jgi:hypothetical protein